jgi:transposase-like protein
VTDQAFVQQEIIDGSLLDPADIRCPQCKKNTIVCSGQSQIASREVWEEGVVTSQTSDATSGGAFDIQRIDCLNCNKTFLLRNPELFQLERENLKLKQKVTDLQRELIERGGAPPAAGANLGWMN